MVLPFFSGIIAEISRTPLPTPNSTTLLSQLFAVEISWINSMLDKMRQLFAEISTSPHLLHILSLNRLPAQWGLDVPSNVKMVDWLSNFQRKVDYFKNLASIGHYDDSALQTSHELEDSRNFPIYMYQFPSALFTCTFFFFLPIHLNFFFFPTFYKKVMRHSFSVRTNISLDLISPTEFEVHWRPLEDSFGVSGLELTGGAKFEKPNLRLEEDSERVYRRFGDNLNGSSTISSSSNNNNNNSSTLGGTMTSSMSLRRVGEEEEESRGSFFIRPVCFARPSEFPSYLTLPVKKRGNDNILCWLRFPSESAVTLSEKSTLVKRNLTVYIPS